MPRSAAMFAPLLAVLAIAMAVGAVFGAAWRPGMVFSGMDYTHLILPQMAWGAMVRQTCGEWPLWNPMNWCGAPFLAAMQSMPLYPPALLAAALLGPVMASKVLIFLHLVWLGLGVAALCRGVGANWAGATLGGATVATGGFVFGHLEQVNTIVALSWTPWLLVCAGRMQRPGAVLRLGAASASAC